MYQESVTETEVQYTHTVAEQCVEKNLEAGSGGIVPLDSLAYGLDPSRWNNDEDWGWSVVDV
jgi:hypothetical protein